MKCYGLNLDFYLLYIKFYIPSNYCLKFEFELDEEISF